MAKKLFGTDGVRGEVNTSPMTADQVLKLAQAAGLEFKRKGHRNRVVIGKDTRLSGYMLEPALVAGFISVGMDVYLAGPLPTPAVSMLTCSLRADLGVMISASHNPYFDNGIKLFRPDGHKLSDHIEACIEERMENAFIKPLVDSSELGRAYRLDDARGRYIQHTKSTFPKNLKLDGLKVVVDCANGAAYKIAPNVFQELGAQVISISNDPDGYNINKDCGATHVEAMCQRVLEEKADLGIALDGDADRLVMCDEKGQVLDGDQLIALIAKAFHEKGKLAGDTVVTTIMSNMGMEKHLNTYGIRCLQTGVGDRYVFEAMKENNFNVGGEQSGHIILTDFAPTGDGIVAALQVLAILVEKGGKASDVANVFAPYPQILENVRVHDKSIGDSAPILAAVKEAEASLAGNGRIVLRPSGTEPLIRVMAEGEDQDQIQSIVQGIVQKLKDVSAELTSQKAI